MSDLNTLRDGMTTPSSETADALNEIRTSHNVFSVDYSDIFALKTSHKDTYGSYMTLAEYGLDQLGKSYRHNPQISWGSGVDELDIYRIPNWRYTTDNEHSDQNRTTFGKAQQCVSTCNYGFWANAEYSTTKTFSGVSGGDDFPIYPADMRYIANGTSQVNGKDTPGAGYESAVLDLTTALQDQKLYFDYLNAMSYVVFIETLQTSGSTVQGLDLLNNIYPILTSDNYQRYLQQARSSESADIRSATEYFLRKELLTASFLWRKSVSEIDILLHSANISAIFSDAYNAKNSYAADEYFDTTLFPYIILRYQLAAAGSTNSLVKTAAGGLQVLSNLLTTPRQQVGGLEFNSEIKNLFMVLSGDLYLGKSSSIVLDSSSIEDVVNASSTNHPTFYDLSTKNQLIDALKKLNSSGLLGTIGLAINITRAVYDTMYLRFAVLNDKVTPQQVMSFIARYLGVYSGLGNLSTFLKTLSAPTRQCLQGVSEMLRLDQVNPLFWGVSGAMAQGLDVADSVELANLESETARIARNFAELPFADENSYINTLFEQEISAGASGVSSSARAQIEDIAQRAVGLVTDDIETITERAVTSTAASFGVKAFGITTSLAGLTADVLYVAADITTIATSENPSAQNYISLTADTLSLGASTIGVGIAFGILEAEAFPVIAIGLGLGGIVLGLANTIISLVDSSESRAEVRQQTSSLLQTLETAGYLHDWGVRIQFLSAYYDVFRDPVGGQDKQTRWSSADIAIFDDEAAAWQKFLETNGTTGQRLKAALNDFIHVPATVINIAEASI